jgi:endonuclease YncB( thermonuclease family)
MARVLPAATLLAFMVFQLLGLARTAPPAQPFQRINGCMYKPQRWNDGDSFHVILPDQKELVFRLYFVDAPEEERVYADRIAEQAAYFGISTDAAVEIGREASEFTKEALAKPLTIYTRWRRALGRSALWRYYAIVVTGDGHDLNELLVSNGLARIYGTRTPLPDGRNSREYLAHLRELESDRDEKRFIVKADDLLTAFLSLERDAVAAKGANGNATRHNVG